MWRFESLRGRVPAIRVLVAPQFPPLNLSTHTVDGVAPTTYYTLKKSMPSVCRPIRRYMFRRYVTAAVEGHSDEEKHQQLLKAFQFGLWEFVYLVSWAASLVVIFWPLVGVPILLLLGCGKAHDPTVNHFNKELLPVSPDDLVDAMSMHERFVVLEGPKGTGKSTAMKLASRSVWCPLYVQLVSAPPRHSDYVLYYIGQCFFISETQTRVTLQVLRRLGVPLKLFVDVETAQLDLHEFTKHVKRLVADQGSPMIMASIAVADSKVFTYDPRLSLISATERTVEDSRAFLESVGVKDAPDSLLLHSPRTPLHMKTLLPRLRQGKAVAEHFVEAELESVVASVGKSFATSKDSKSLLTDAAKPNATLEWPTILEKCGPNYVFKQESAFIDIAVTTEQLFRPIGKWYGAQFDQTREAFRRYATRQG